MPDDRLSAAQRAELAEARARIARLEAIANRPPSAAELAAMTKEEIADELAQPGGRARLAAALSGQAGPDETRFGDPKYIASLSPETVADHWPAIESALSQSKETPA